MLRLSLRLVLRDEAFSLFRHSNVLALLSFLLWNRFLDIVGLFLSFLNAEALRRA